ncbi:hypothetical protein OA57_08300 [Chelonobacter oris]|uniref:Uncharacterized protein n=1 Tax=Chelonobacter oris TaxID=505317 RepID=A0A0A3ASJ3_9PAST|nr:hypothetical protein OA57_08300 [Chelonobacter oris]
MHVNAFSLKIDRFGIVVSFQTVFKGGLLCGKTALCAQKIFKNKTAQAVGVWLQCRFCCLAEVF